MFDLFWLNKVFTKVVWFDAKIKVFDEEIKWFDEEIKKKIKEIVNLWCEYENEVILSRERINMLENKLDIAKKYIKDSESRKQNEIWYIYLIQDHTWITKIWMTKNIKNRVLNYKTENPYWINVIYTFEHTDYIEIEKELHKMMHNKCVRWEWFNLDDNDISQIILYCEKR